MRESREGIPCETQFVGGYFLVKYIMELRIFARSAKIVSSSVSLPKCKIWSWSFCIFHHFLKNSAKIKFWKYLSMICATRKCKLSSTFIQRKFLGTQFHKIKMKSLYSKRNQKSLGFKLRVSNVGSPACDNNVWVIKKWAENYNIRKTGTRTLRNTRTGGVERDRDSQVIQLSSSNTY